MGRLGRIRDLILKATKMPWVGSRQQVIRDEGSHFQASLGLTENRQGSTRGRCSEVVV